MTPDLHPDEITGPITAHGSDIRAYISDDYLELHYGEDDQHPYTVPARLLNAILREYQLRRPFDRTRYRNNNQLLRMDVLPNFGKVYEELTSMGLSEDDIVALIKRRDKNLRITDIRNTMNAVTKLESDLQLKAPVPTLDRLEFRITEHTSRNPKEHIRRLFDQHFAAHDRIVSIKLELPDYSGVDASLEYMDCLFNIRDHVLDVRFMDGRPVLATEMGGFLGNVSSILRGDLNYSGDILVKAIDFQNYRNSYVDAISQSKSLDLRFKATEFEDEGERCERPGCEIYSVFMATTNQTPRIWQLCDDHTKAMRLGEVWW